jgi:hypothetical protein
VIALADSRDLILSHVEGAKNVTLSWSRPRRNKNWGIHLLVAGTKQLLASENISYKEVGRKAVRGLDGDLLIVCGGGWWDHAQGIVDVLTHAGSFRRVLVMPSTFDTNSKPIRRALSSTRATLLARDHVTAERLGLPLAHDGAFFYDYRLWERAGSGDLLAFRTDSEASGAPVPAGSNDISSTAPSFRAWMETIAGAENVRTDRTHVLIAAALMGKRVELSPSAYWKNKAVKETWFSDYPVTMA